MNCSNSTLHLYCVNIECFASVFKNTMHIRIPLTEENLLAPHICFCCGHNLVSSIDLEIEQVTAGYILN
ncbi:hypothetical protein MgSA37_02512 [Mucilaginibacter gotjawali]|uniref:Uncharacterized protein n=2 Tax=Mucilaginibacter gotjawali TaxID=1550579 RepID=A0A839S8V9_9SPHI|nr:hypothetical protein [Mucilaginibacter gotjawali]BAU54337.1 hypothetical protein MgSA37_02512 [Mucilaginibacter gotjawali]